MEDVENSLIKYTGLADSFPTLNSTAPFKQFIIQENITMPNGEPNIGQLVRISANVEITRTKIRNTPTGVSEEGQILTGKKLIVEGYLDQWVEYIPAKPNQCVHTTSFKVPFCTFIVLPASCTLLTIVTVQSFIEDLNVQKIDKRNILETVAIFLLAIIEEETND